MKVMNTKLADFEINTTFDLSRNEQVIFAKVSGQVFKEICYGSSAPGAIKGFGMALTKMGLAIQKQIEELEK